MMDPFGDPAVPGTTMATDEESSQTAASVANDEHEEEEQRQFGKGRQAAGGNVDTTLTLDSNTILTLGADALVVRDQTLAQRRSARTCCGLLRDSRETTRSIPYTHVLWSSVDAFSLTIRYAQSSGKKSCRAATLSYNLAAYSLSKNQHTAVEQWTESLLSRAYPTGTQRAQRITVLVNPFGGQGYAEKIWTRTVAPILAAANCHIAVQRTTHRGHAREIARELDVDAWDVVACASGDGLPHEVFNGLAQQAKPRRALRKIAVVQLPCGSGNALSLNLAGTDSPSLAALALVKGVRWPLDLVAITQGEKRYYSFLSQAVGLIAETDLGTESLRWMGPLRFTWGFLVRILFKTEYPADVAVVLESDDKRAIKDMQQTLTQSAKPLHSSTSLNDEDDNESSALPPLQYGTVADPLPAAFTFESHSTLGNFYAGNMCYMSPDAPFFSASLPCDGHADLITSSARISRRTALGMIFALPKGTLIDLPDVKYRRVRAYRVWPGVNRVKDPSPAASGSGSGGKRSVKERLGKWLGGGQPAGLIAMDGESVPFEPFQAEVIPGLATVLGRSDFMLEARLRFGGLQS